MTSHNQKIHIVILIGGKAKRINKEINCENKKNILIKSFLEIGSMPIIFHIIHSILSGLENFSKETTVSFIINDSFQEPHLLKISKFLKKIGFENLDFEFIIQNNQDGTGGAALCFLENTKFKLSDDDLCFIFLGDHPLIKSETIEKFLSSSINQFALNESILGVFGCFEDFNLENQYGRIEFSKSNSDIIEKIHEFKDYKNNQEIKKIKTCNGPISLFKIKALKQTLNLVEPKNNSFEKYLHDVIQISKERNLGSFAAFIIQDSNEASGINTFEELERVEELFQKSYREKFSSKKIQFLNINTITFAPFIEIEDCCQIGLNVQFKPFVNIKEFTKIESFCILGENLEIGQNCIIKSHSVLSDSKIENSCEIGPFAHLNSNNEIGRENIIGNFTEIKRSKIGPKNKAKHFVYIADAEIGEENNFGAVVIFCNFDGKKKNKIKIGNKNFIGAHVSLIAPLQIGESNLVAAGGVITKDIQDKKLILARANQIEKDRKDKK